MYKKQEPLCNCRICGSIFSLKETNIYHHKLYNITIDEKVCPKCGSCEYENIFDRRFLDRYLFFSNTNTN